MVHMPIIVILGISLVINMFIYLKIRIQFELKMNNENATHT